MTREGSPYEQVLKLEAEIADLRYQLDQATRFAAGQHVDDCVHKSVVEELRATCDQLREANERLQRKLDNREVDRNHDLCTHDWGPWVIAIEGVTADLYMRFCNRCDMTMTGNARNEQGGSDG